MTITLDGTEGITAPNVFGRNLIINGSGRINQRGYTSGTATSGANEYTLDRWRVVTSGQDLTFTGNDAGRVMTAPAGGCEQVIEGANIAGGTYVLNWTGTATATVDGNAVGKGDTFTLTANTNATVRMIGGTFSEVQVEEGLVPTSFERRPVGTELALCQRYYHRVTRLGGGGYATSSGQTARAIASIVFPVKMRVSPSVSVNATPAGNSNGVVGHNLSTADSHSISYESASSGSIFWHFDGGEYIAYDAEL